MVVAENYHKSSPNLDSVVYKKQQLWRLWKSSKVGKTNYKFLENSEQVPNNRILPQQIDGCIKVDLLEEFKAKPMNSPGFEEADVPEQVQESLEGKNSGCSIDGSRVHFNGSPCPIHKSVHERENGYVFCMEKTWFFKCHRQIRGEKSVFLRKEPEDPIPEELIVKDCFNFKDEYFYNDLS